MKEKLENLFYAIIGISWAALGVLSVQKIFGDSPLFEVLGFLCGISLGGLIVWGIKYLTLRLNKKI
jgi:hypothetical protein